MNAPVHRQLCYALFATLLTAKFFHLGLDFLFADSSKSVCDVNSAARVLQVAKLHKPGRHFLLVSAV